ncbi:hypothetical protein M413DRAFT_74977, partial [Hebeloma cylindrosporum]
FLAALLGREALRPELAKCSHCTSDCWAVWRCQDCTLANPLCRRCMRVTHEANPLHKIQRWTGTHFRAAELWEVGTYLLVPHHAGEPICTILRTQASFLEKFEEPKDKLEQEKLSRTDHESGPIPRSDAFNNSYVRIVHTNGLHYLALVTCQCRGNVPQDLIASRLVPASLQNTRTLFSAQVLDFFRLCNLEMKASAYQFYHLLRRLTLPTAPAEVVDLYNEFRRMTRLWRWMKKLKWAGYGHNGKDATNVGAGELANFCPACPQPGVNLPENWKLDIHRWVFKFLATADGNFKANHIFQPNPFTDRWLWDGAGMFPNREEYKQFLLTAMETRSKAPCENTFRAISNALAASKVCDITGIVAIACARHGCFIPNAMVNLFKSEQQKNVDFALLKTIEAIGIDPEQGMMLMYDIVCQYIINLQMRIGHLLPLDLEIDRAIGMFHVHAHKEQCFFRYSPSLIPGAGVTAGEILESLWSGLNGISPSTRTATLAHRAEVLDDHACDSNHKKLLGMTKTLSRRYNEATENHRVAVEYLAEQTGDAEPLALQYWRQQIESAERRRLTNPSGMDIYGAQTHIGKGRATTSSAPDADPDSAPHTAVEIWLEFALVIEEKQIDIRQRVRHLGRDPRGEDRQKIEKLRTTLAPLLVELNRLQANAGVYQSAPHAGDRGQNQSDDPFDNDVEDDASSDPLAIWDVIVDGEEEDAPAVPPGPLPSAPPPSAPPPSAPPPRRTRSNVELVLRQKQARTHLQQLRQLIAEKSFQYSDVMRKAPRKGIITRARGTLKGINSQISWHCQVYSHCRDRLIALGADAEVLQEFCELKKEHVNASTAILKPNARGSKKLKLSWIWASVRRHVISGADDEVPAEADAAAILESVKRVHWLRARAQEMRWQEEVILVEHEMEWTVRYFLHKMDYWRAPPPPDREPPSSGAAAYAARKCAMWHDLALYADKSFKNVNINYKSLFSLTRN